MEARHISVSHIYIALNYRVCLALKAPAYEHQQHFLNEMLLFIRTTTEYLQINNIVNSSVITNQRGENEKREIEAVSN